MRMWIRANRRLMVLRISTMAAPRGEVTIPSVLGRRGSGFFRRGSKSPSARSFSLSCSKASCRAPLPLGSMSSADELVLAPLFIDRDPPAADDLQTVLEVEPGPARVAPPHDRLELAALVLEGEIEMAGRRSLEIGDLALHPDGREGALQLGLDHFGDLGDRVHAIGLHQAVAIHRPPRYLRNKSPGGSPAPGRSRRPPRHKRRRGRRPISPARTAAGATSGIGPAPATSGYR